MRQGLWGTAVLPVKLQDLIPVKLGFLTFLLAALDLRYVRVSESDGGRASRKPPAF